MNEINLRPILTVEDKNTFVSEIQEALKPTLQKLTGKESAEQSSL